MIYSYIRTAIRTLIENKDKLGIIPIPDFEKIKDEDKQKIVDILGNYALKLSGDKPFIYNRQNSDLSELIEICHEIEKYGETGIPKEQKEKLDIEEKIKELQKENEQLKHSSIPIEKIGLSNRSLLRLRQKGAKIVQDIIDIDKEIGLERVSGLGEKSVYEIREKIDDIYRERQGDDSVEILDEEDTEKSDEKTETNDLQAQRLLSVEEEYQRILDEQEQINKGGINDSATPNEEAERIEAEKKQTELQMLRAKRDRLLEKQKKLQEKILQAKGLSASYDRLNGNLQENETPNLDD